jgi:hypothetical protein
MVGVFFSGCDLRGNRSDGKTMSMSQEEALEPSPPSDSRSSDVSRPGCSLPDNALPKLALRLEALNATVALESSTTTGAPIRLGSIPLQYARSTMKVPLVVALVSAIGGVQDLSPDQVALATSAIRDSDNAAAAALYADLDAATGNASGSIEKILREAGDKTTEVPTSIPPGLPPSFISTYGATIWTVTNQVRFLRALQDGIYGRSEGMFVLGLMKGISTEGGGTWGFGAIYPKVSYKPGWGGDNPDGEYLARQIGFLPIQGHSVALALAALGSTPDEAYSAVTQALALSQLEFSDGC